MKRRRASQSWAPLSLFGTQPTSKSSLYICHSLLLIHNIDISHLCTLSSYNFTHHNLRTFVKVFCLCFQLPTPASSRTRWTSCKRAMRRRQRSLQWAHQQILRWCMQENANRTYVQERRRGKSARRRKATKVYVSSYHRLTFPSVSHSLSDLTSISPYQTASQSPRTSEGDVGLRLRR